MKKQKIKFHTSLLKAILFALVGGFHGQALIAQLHRIDYSGKYQDITLPSSVQTQYIKLTAAGGDGGRNRAKTAHTNVASGRGALVQATFKIGNGSNEIPPGSTIRFIAGQQGGNYETSAPVPFGTGGGGGGGTGIAFKGPHAGDRWQLLMVAGGGGGSSSDCCDVRAEGHPGKPYATGQEGQGYTVRKDLDVYDGGSVYLSSNAGENRDYLDNVGWKDGPDAGSPTGGPGPHDSGRVHAGWGFGPGGTGSTTSPQGGGGGGYTGGKAAKVFSSLAQGGTSFVNESMSIGEFVSHDQGTTTSPASGYCEYEYTNTRTISKTIHLAKAPTKCIDDYRQTTAVGTNIQLYTCQEGNPAQAWVIDGPYIHLAKDYNKCLTVEGPSFTAGTNIQLGDCNGPVGNTWIYNPVDQSIRQVISAGTPKCLEVTNGGTANGSNIQLWDCNNSDGQKWLVDDIDIGLPTGTNLQIHLRLEGDKCLDIYEAYTGANGNNIRLYTCHTYNHSQFFTFDDNKIKMQLYPNKCLDLTQSNFSNGANIQLWDCNGTDAQNWIYDGFSKAFRSAAYPQLCLDVDHSNFNNGTNVQLWSCNGTYAQQFEIY